MTRRVLAAAAAWIVAGTGSAFGQALWSWSSEGANGPSVSVGLLAQAEGSWTPATDGLAASGSLCFRRLRFIAGGRAAPRLSFFIESDSPNLGYRSGQAFNPSIGLQDLVVTYRASPAFALDVGLLMVPISYNSTQSAASLLAVGYGPYSFLSSQATGSKVGRDEGLQARGYLRGGHVEYRAGIFRGARQSVSGLPPRWAGRLVWYPLDGQDGFFYTGTTLGKRRLVSLGVSADRQDAYGALGADVFVDQPLPGGRALTFQADYLRYDGGRTFASLPRQHTWLFETGYLWGAARLGAFTQVAIRRVVAKRAPNTASYQGGLIFWARGARLNLKVGAGAATRAGSATRPQVVAQLQFFAF